MKNADFAQCQIAEILAKKHHYLCGFNLPNGYIVVGNYCGTTQETKEFWRKHL
jgi:hypothetical protein